MTASTDLLVDLTNILTKKRDYTNDHDHDHLLSYRIKCA